jgi:hypothetical protein
MKGSTRKAVKKSTAKKARKKAAPKKRIVEVDLVDLAVADGGEPDGLHLLAMEEFCKDRITLEDLNELLALHSRKAVATLPADDDEDYDNHLEDLVNA